MYERNFQEKPEDVAPIRDNLLEALEALENERELRNRVVSALSHDLRSPLTTARLSAQLVARRADADPQMLSYARRIVDSVDRADRMIRDLVDANLVAAGKRLSLETTTCDLRVVAQSLIDELSKQHGARIHLYAPPVVTGRCDPSALRRLLENLAQNALKHGDPETEVGIALREHADSIEVAVHNEGPPIPAEEQEHLFDPHRQMRSGLADRHKGFGIGLTLVKGIAEAHGGSVSVESAPGRGTTFRVMLPKRPPSKRQ